MNRAPKKKAPAGPEELAALGVGLPPDVQPLEHLRMVLEREGATWGGRKPLLLTHKSPDPDALGALIGLAFLLRNAFDLDPDVATTGKIYRAENLTMVRELGLEFLDYEALDFARYGGILLVDTQPGFGHTPLPEEVPVIGVFDHHEPPTRETVLARTVPPHYDLRLGVGATSSMIYGYLRDAGVELDPRTATALTCGVRFDTADLSLDVTPLDSEAYYESFRHADRSMLARIARPALPPSYYKELHRSLSRARRQGPLVIGLLGRVKNPESVAEMADFFMRMEGCQFSLVGGAYEDTYHLSVRSDLAYSDAYPLIEAVVDGEGSFGGRGPVAGGQISLESTDDRDLIQLERRLRRRALELVQEDESNGSDPKNGIRLTRLP